jgi:hypothetical protein
MYEVDGLYVFGLGTNLAFFSLFIPARFPVPNFVCPLYFKL